MPSEPLPGCHALVLAAGAGTRFDGAKLLAEFRGEPLARHAVRAMLASRVERVTVVLGARAAEVRAALYDLDGPRLTTVECVEWHEGLSASLSAGIAVMPRDCRALSIALGDMPNLAPALADSGLAYVLAGAPAVLPEFAGRPGHPVALAPALFDRVARLTGDRGVRSVLGRTKGVVRIDSEDPGCVQDVDTRTDLAHLA